MTTFTGSISVVNAGDTTTLSTKLATHSDALKATSETWTPYTPTWTAATTNPTLGNGSFTGSAYMRVNKLVIFRIVLIMGSTTTYGVGQWSLTVPVTPASDYNTFGFGFVDASAGAFYHGRNAASPASNSRLDIWADTGGAGGALSPVGAAAPFTWATSDRLMVGGAYEGA